MNPKKHTKTGKIIPNGVSLEKHENDIVVYFTELGYDIELIKPSNTPKNKNADFIMDGKIWEMKSPNGKTKTSLDHMFKKAILQSENLIFDLRMIKYSEEIAVKELERRFKQTRRCRRLIIIKKNFDKLDYTK